MTTVEAMILYDIGTPTLLGLLLLLNIVAVIIAIAVVHGLEILRDRWRR
jgi:hypothetical protein